MEQVIIHICVQNSSIAELLLVGAIARDKRHQRLNNSVPSHYAAVRKLSDMQRYEGCSTDDSH